MSNLPPGVTLNMIPGNRPEDEAEERFWEALWTALEVEVGAEFLENPRTEKVVNWVRDHVWKQAFEEGRTEAGLDQFYRTDDLLTALTDRGILTPADLDAAFKRAEQAAVAGVLDHALNSGDGTYRP